MWPTLKIQMWILYLKSESKSQEAQALFNDIKGLKKHHSIVKIGNARPEYIQDKAFWELYNELNL